MSALGVLVNFDGRPVDRAALCMLATTIDGVAPCADEIAIDGWCGLARAGASLVPPDDTIGRPIATADGRLQVLFEGRIDNRDDLIASLNDTRHRPRSRADAEVFASAAAAWGAEAWDRVLGDFAAVIIDRERRHVTAVRDAFGIRPLLYRCLRGGVAVSQTVAALARLGPVTIDDEMMGQYLAGVVSDLAASSCREIRRVPPGHALTIDATGARITRYLSLAPDTIDDARSAEAYADELRALLQRSVAARLRGGRAAIMLSGGLDSAAITALVPAPAQRDVRTYSLLYPGSHKDEQPWSDAVVRHLGIEHAHTRIPIVDAVGFDYRAHVDRTLEPAPAPTGVTSVPLRGRARADGTRIVISGVGGDELFTGNWSRYADFLRAGRVVTLLRGWLADRRHPLYEGDRYALLSAVGPLVPQWLRPAGRVLAAVNAVPAVIAPAYATRIGLAARLRLAPLPERFASYAQADIWRLVTGGPVLQPLEQEQLLSQTFGADQRFPFFDRRVIEFALRLPESERWADATSKVVLRRALQGRVPDAIQRGISVHDYSFLLLPALRALAPSAGASWRVVEHGWVDRRVLDRMLSTLHTSPDAALASAFRFLWPLWNVLACELLTHAIEGAPAIEPLRRIQYTQSNGEPDVYRETTATKAAG